MATPVLIWNALLIGKHFQPLCRCMRCLIRKEPASQKLSASWAILHSPAAWPGTTDLCSLQNPTAYYAMMAQTTVSCPARCATHLSWIPLPFTPSSSSTEPVRQSAEIMTPFPLKNISFFFRLPDFEGLCGLQPFPAPTVLLSSIAPLDGGPKVIGMGPDGRLYISIGAACSGATCTCGGQVKLGDDTVTYCSIAYLFPNGTDFRSKITGGLNSNR